MDSILFSDHTKVSSSLLVIIILLSIILLQPGREHILNNLMLSPYNVVRKKKLFSIFTSSLIHADYPHLLFNGITFFYFALPLEGILIGHSGSPLGSIIFLIIFVSSLLIADLPSIIKHRNNPNYNSLGASGAISGVLFSYILFQPMSRLSLMLVPFPVPAPLFAVLFIVFSIYADRKYKSHINHQAHIWGGIGGFTTTCLFYPDEFGKFVRILFDLI